ncbi:MAG: efflux transporter outer membrane subunit [Rhizobacter sp.]|nr:efflux transporter outer membrane subunit [Rhizobacter sp.]
MTLRTTFRIYSSVLLAGALTGALAGCSLAPALPEPDLALPAAYKEVAAAEGRWKPAAPAEAAPRGEWWVVFGDERLNALQQQAASASPTLALAAARVRAARASLDAAEAGRWPQLGLSAGASRARSAPATLGVPDGTAVSPATVLQAGLGARYEIDLFQRVGNGITAAQADAQGVEASYRSVLLALQADVAQTYFALRTLDAELAQLDATLGLRNENNRLIEKRFQAGDVGELDVARSRTELSTVQAERAALHGQRARTEHALALLLGQAPAAFTLAPAPLPAAQALPEVPAGVPSALLERRPDITAAQRSLAAATARVGVARSALFPALALTAEGGHASSELENLFKWSSRAWLASVVMSLPILDGGRNQAVVTQANAQLDGAVAAYRGTVLAAFADVEDSLATLQSVREQVDHVDTALVSARRAAELAGTRYRAGEDSYLQLLDAQRDLLAVERQAVRLRGSWAGSTVGLIRSLGGSWSTQ